MAADLFGRGLKSPVVFLSSFQDSVGVAKRYLISRKPSYFPVGSTASIFMLVINE